MAEDSIVSEVHAIRKKIEEECLYDIKNIIERAVQIQIKYQDRLVRSDIQTFKTGVVLKS